VELVLHLSGYHLIGHCDFRDFTFVSVDSDIIEFLKAHGFRWIQWRITQHTLFRGRLTALPAVALARRAIESPGAKPLSEEDFKEPRFSSQSPLLPPSSRSRSLTSRPLSSISLTNNDLFELSLQYSPQTIPSNSTTSRI